MKVLFAIAFEILVLALCESTADYIKTIFLLTTLYFNKFEINLLIISCLFEIRIQCNIKYFSRAPKYKAIIKLKMIIKFLLTISIIIEHLIIHVRDKQFSFVALSIFITAILLSTQMNIFFAMIFDRKNRKLRQN